jgi:hypothetical protein
MNRRMTLATVGASLVTMVAGRGAKAQNQSAGNDVQIVSTGDVTLDQDVTAAQNMIVRDAHGNVIRSAGQVVYNDGQIVSTGDVTVSQSVDSSQNMEIETTDYGDEQLCTPGQVYAELEDSPGRLWFCDMYCQWVPVPVCYCQPKECEGRKCH